MLVRIDKSWQNPDLLQQTPGGRGLWNGIQFTLEPVSNPDYYAVLNHVPRDTTVTVPRSRIWCFIQEPPEPIYRWMRKGFNRFAKVYTQETQLRGSAFIHSHGSLPWHAGRSYDQLSAETTPPKKTGDLSWITSNLAITPGHRRRLRFLDRLRTANVPFDLFGRGFNPIPLKYDGLAPYRYTLAIEKMTCEHYWSEKLADCFLAWSMPIYYGATRIDDYFPKDSYVRIDINDPDAPRQVLSIIRSDLAERNRDAIAEARRRVLEEHNLFPRLARLIAEDQVRIPAPKPETLHIPANPDLTRYYITHSLPHRIMRSALRRLLPAH